MSDRDHVFKQENGRYMYVCECGKEQKNFTDFNTALIAYRLHKLGCKS